VQLTLEASTNFIAVLNIELFRYYFVTCINITLMKLIVLN